MKKTQMWLVLALIAGVLATLAASAAPSVTTHNGVVYAYVSGQSITIRGFAGQLQTYNLTSKILVLPDSSASGSAAGARVTVVSQCYTTRMTSGCLALGILVRQPASASDSAQSTTPAATPVSPPAPTPTP